MRHPQLSQMSKCPHRPEGIGGRDRKGEEGRIVRARRRWNQNVINTRETATARRGRAGRRRGRADAALLSTDTRAAARRAHGGASEPCPSVGASCGIKELPQVGVQGKEGAPGEASPFRGRGGDSRWFFPFTCLKIKNSSPDVSCASGPICLDNRVSSRSVEINKHRETTSKDRRRARGRAGGGEPPAQPPQSTSASQPSRYHPFPLRASADAASKVGAGRDSTNGETTGKVWAECWLGP